MASSSSLEDRDFTDMRITWSLCNDVGSTMYPPLEGYLQIFNFGMPPHGGFAIGLERLVMRLTGAENIRETTLFPRDMSRLSP